MWANQCNSQCVSKANQPKRQVDEEQTNKHMHIHPPIQRIRMHVTAKLSLFSNENKTKRLAYIINTKEPDGNKLMSSSRCLKGARSVLHSILLSPRHVTSHILQHQTTNFSKIIRPSHELIETVQCTNVAARTIHVYARCCAGYYIVRSIA